MSHAAAPAEWLASGLSPMAASLRGSSILLIAARVRELVAGGREVCNLTIGDFDPKAYPVPTELRVGTKDALDAGHTNYPPANGIPALRNAVAGMYGRRLGISVDPANVSVASGARPLLYAAYNALVGPGDKVVYASPSWNNNHYTQIVAANAVRLPVGPEDNFFPQLEAFEPHLRDARIFFLNSPLNPSGTMIRREVLTELCDSIVRENQRRQAAGEKPLFLLYDQIYWMLRLGDVEHVDPIGVDPRMVDYSIYVDGISKAFAATGMRVGWGISPAPIAAAMNRLLGHVGAWAPHPEQHATAHLLDDDAACDRYLTWIRREARDRLQIIFDHVTAMADRGLPVRALAPEGAIYLSVQIDVRGWKYGDRTLETTAEIGNFLLDEAGVAVVPFDAFGATHAQAWFRLSVGAVEREALSRALERIEAAIDRLQRP